VHGFSAAVGGGVLTSVHFYKISVDMAVDACFNNKSPL
jgi:hypothetical protein